MDLSDALRCISHHLHPPALKYVGICAALKSLCDDFAKTNNIKIDVLLPVASTHILVEVELCIFRLSQECLQNIAKHANASRVSLALAYVPGEVQLRVSDNGRGFSLDSDDTHSGLGLLNMKGRVLAINGRFEVHSAPGIGTEVCTTIPL